MTSAAPVYRLDMSRRPKPFGVGDVRVNCTRLADDDGRPYWRATVSEGGHRRAVWNGRATRAEAQRIVAALVANGVPAPTARASQATAVATVKDLLEVYLGEHQAPRVATGQIRASTLKTNKRTARRLIRVLGGWRLADLGSDVLKRAEAALLQAGTSSGTIRGTDRPLLLAAWRWGRAWHGGPLVPDVEPVVPALKHRPVRDKVTPTRDQLRALLVELDGLSMDWPRRMVIAQAGTGARVGEIASVTPADVHGDTLRIPDAASKTGAREVPLSAEVRAALAGGWPVTVLTARSRINHYIREACDAAGLPRFTTHGLRRFAANRMIDAGVSERDICAITGMSRATLARYYAQSTPASRAAAIRLANLIPLEDDGAEVIELRPAGGE